jgi:hypothetical protein
MVVLIRLIIIRMMSLFVSIKINRKVDFLPSRK